MSRELDKLVHEHVMGLVWTVYGADDSLMPRYSSDIAAAMSVLEKDHPGGWFDGFYLMRYGAGYAIGCIGDDAIYEEADTIAEVICLAALKYLGLTSPAIPAK